MKVLSKLLCLSALCFAFAACERDYDMPPLEGYTYTGNAGNTTIKDLRTLAASLHTDSVMTIDNDLILEARISGNDVSGNIYKTIYVQDSTGNIPVLVDQSNVYTDYAVGQTVYIQLNGLSLSYYGKELQIGHPKGTSYRIPYVTFKKVVLRSGLADASQLTVKEVSDLSTLTESDRFALIKLTGAKFEKAGTTTFVEGGVTTTHNLLDSKKNTIPVRTSAYATFANDTLPLGSGTVYGILGRYNGAWQLTLRDANDLQDFDGSVDVKIINETLINSQGSFTVEDVTQPVSGTSVWKFNSYGAVASGYVSGANYASESWLLSPEVSLSGYKSVILNFDQAANYFTDAATANSETSVWIREQGGTWTQLTIPSPFTKLSWTFVNSGDIDLAAYIGKTVQIGFKYTSTATKAGTWEVKNVTVTGTSSN